MAKQLQIAASNLIACYFGEIQMVMTLSQES